MNEYQPMFVVFCFVSSELVVEVFIFIDFLQTRFADIKVTLPQQQIPDKVVMKGALLKKNNQRGDKYGESQEILLIPMLLYLLTNHYFNKWCQWWQINLKFG